MSTSKGWKTIRLGDVAKTSSGGTPKRGAAEYYGGDIPWVKSGELGDGTIFGVKEFITQAGLDKSSAKLFPTGTLCIALYGATIGKIGVLGIDAATNQAVCGIFLPEGIDTQFVFYFLESIRRDLIEMGKGGAQPNINQGIIRDIQLPMPGTLDEQRRIVAEIEKQFTRLDAGVAGLKRVQANLKRYRASVLKAACEGKLVPTEAQLQRKLETGNLKPEFETGEQLLVRILIERRKAHEEQQATAPRKKKYKQPAAPDLSDLPDLPDGWAWCISDVVFSFITSGSRGWAKYYSEEGSLFLRIGNLEHENIRLDLSKLQYVTPPIGAEGMRTVVQENDILISITADVGMVGLVPNGLGEAYINQHVALARPVSLVNSSYIAYYLCASEGGWGLFKKRQRGATKAGLGLDDIRSIPVPLPPLAEQKRIVEEVERRLSVIDEMEAAVATNLKRAARLRQSILKKAFEGKLV